jgi:hypothetical protein
MRTADVEASHPSRRARLRAGAWRWLSPALCVWHVAGAAAALDPTTADCLAAAEKATTHRQQRELRAARSELLICAAMSCPADVRQECSRRVDEVNASMPTVVFEVKDDRESDLSAVRVQLDGQLLTERLEGTALSIDPGEHTFRFEASGMRPIDRRFVIRVGEKERRERIRFERVEPLPQPRPDIPAAAATRVNPTLLKEQSAPQTRESSQPLQTVGYALGAAAVGTLAVAAYEQSVAISRQSKSKDAANSDDAAVQATSPELHAQARSAQTYAIVTGAIGLAALGTAVYLVVRSMRAESTQPQQASRLRLQPFFGLATGGLQANATW